MNLPLSSAPNLCLAGGFFAPSLSARMVWAILPFARVGTDYVLYKFVLLLTFSFKNIFTYGSSHSGFTNSGVGGLGGPKTPSLEGILRPYQAHHTLCPIDG
jgi:hypothetical protein